MSGTPSNANFGRTCTLSLSGGSGSDMVAHSSGLYGLKIAFEIESHTLQSPDLAQFTLYNVSPTTAAKVQGEFKEVVFTAGFEFGSGEGEIFRGQIVETQYGEKTDNFTTTMLRIWCANSDLAYRARVNTTLAAGSTHQDIVNASLKAMQDAQPGFSMGQIVGIDLTQPRFVRGIPLVGMARDFLREVALKYGATFTLSGNKLDIIHRSAEVPGAGPVILSSTSGMINQPIQRVEGIIVQCLINPAIQLNSTIQVQSSIVSPSVSTSPVIPGSADRQAQLSNQLSTNGRYRVIHMLTRGDTRGPDWSQTLTTIGVGQNVNATQAGLGYS
ncbi:MAG: baseplate hub protein [Janthinobacterium lividum]